jgi:hypothetical protein
MDRSLTKGAMLTLFLVVVIVAGWELYVRSKGFDTSFDDNPALWADKRDQVYEPSDKSTVFIGSSRIKFDLDIPTWEKLTGDHAVMLACVGSSPLPILDNLANDSRFKGKLVVDVTEILFFSDDFMPMKTPTENLKYYKERTPTQRASFQLNRAVESVFAFLDKDRLSLNAKLDELQLHNRKGVFEFPLFPPDFGRVHFSRQEYMTAKFLKDSNQIKQVCGVWAFLGKINTTPPVSGAKLDSFFTAIKKSVDKIRKRGGQVIFVRTPSSGPFFMAESAGYPRDKYWQPLLQKTQCSGIHFQDHPATSHMQCPEFSHLNGSDAIVFTKELVRNLHEEQHWSFQNIK